MKTTPHEHWSTALVRVGNQAVREAQAKNRQLGIPNWYSLNGQLVSDVQPAPCRAADRPASPHHSALR